MNRSTPGLPVHHQLQEFTQTQVHRVSDAIQPSHPLSSLSPPAPNPSQHQSFPMSQLFAWGGQNTGVSALASFLPKKSHRKHIIFEDRWPRIWLLISRVADSMHMNLRKLWEIVKDREACRAAVHGVTKSRTSRSDWTTKNNCTYSWFSCLSVPLQATPTHCSTAISLCSEN